MKKAIAILFITLVILSSVYAIIDAHIDLGLIILLAIAYLLTFLVVMLNVKPPKASKEFLIILSILIALFPLFLVFAALTHILPDRLYSGAYLGVIIIGLSAAFVITVFIHIIRFLRPPNQTLFILLGLVCALLTAWGIISWHNNPVNTAYRKLHSQHFWERQEAVLVLRNIKDAGPEFARLLQDKDEWILCQSVKALGSLNYQPAIPGIRKLLRHENREVRILAIYALAELNDKESIPEITGLLEDSNPFVRPAAIYSLAHLKGKECIPEITGFLKDNNPYVRNTVLGILACFKAKESIPEIIKLLKDYNEENRGKAVDTLGDIDAKEAIPEITKLLQAKDGYMRWRAEEALKKLGLTNSEIEEAKKAVLQWDDSANGLSCRIASDKTIYNRDEPITLTVTLKNESPYSLAILRPDVADDTTRFWTIESDNGKTERIKPYAQKIIKEHNYTELQAGNSLNFHIDVKTIWKFAPGIYKIKASHSGSDSCQNPDGSISVIYDAWSGTVYSNSITIKITD